MICTLFFFLLFFPPFNEILSPTPFSFFFFFFSLESYIMSFVVCAMEWSEMEWNKIFRMDGLIRVVCALLGQESVLDKEEEKGTIILHGGR